MKANSGWVDDDVYISLSRNVFLFSPRLESFSLSYFFLSFFKNDNAIYGETDKVAAGTNAARALRSLHLVRLLLLMLSRSIDFWDNVLSLCVCVVLSLCFLSPWNIKSFFGVPLKELKEGDENNLKGGNRKNHHLIETGAI